MKQTSTRERILEAAMERFFEFGFNSVTVDEISGALGISKRTLYEHFPGKRELLREGLEDRVERVAEGLRQVVETERADYFTKLAEAMRYMVEHLPRPGRRFFQDMSRSAPEVWRVVEAKRDEALRRHFGRLFREGVQRGALRSDLNSDFVLAVFLALVHDLIRPEIMAEMPMSIAQVFEKLASILMVGVLTERAAAEYRRTARGKAES